MPARLVEVNHEPLWTYSPVTRRRYARSRRSPRLSKPSQRSLLLPRRRRSPATKGAPKKLVPPVRGEAAIGYLKPVTKQDKNMIITTIKIKNLSNGAIAGLKVDEFWYDKDGESGHRLSAVPVAQAAAAWRGDRRRAEGSAQSGDEPEPVQVRARQRHDQDDAAAEALDHGRHIRSAIDAATGIRHRRPVAACQIAATHSTTPASQIKPAAQTQNPNALGHEQQRRRRDA